MNHIDRWEEPRPPKELEQKMNEFFANMKKLWLDFIKEKDNARAWLNDDTVIGKTKKL